MGDWLGGHERKDSRHGESRNVGSGLVPRSAAADAYTEGSPPTTPTPPLPTTKPPTIKPPPENPQLPKQSTLYETRGDSRKWGLTCPQKRGNSSDGLLACYWLGWYH